MNALALSGVLLFAVNAAAAPVAVLRSSGPLEISFKVANPRKSATDRLLFAISLRNVGATDFMLIDRVFSQPNKIAANSVTGAGIHLELHDRSGRVRDIEAADAAWIRGPEAYVASPKARSITIVESEINARKLVIHYSQYYPWKSAAEQKAFIDKITAEIALFEATRLAEEPLKAAGTLPRRRFLNVETTERPDLQVDLDPIREEAARVKQAAEARLFERHLGALRALAGRQCSTKPPAQADFDKLAYREDLSLYQSAATMPQNPAESDCFNRAYSSYLSTLASGGRPTVEPTGEDARRADHLAKLRDMAAEMCAGRVFLEIELDSVPYVPDHCKAGSADRSRGGSQTARPRGAATGSKSARPNRRREESAVSCVRGVSKAVGIQEHVVRRLVVVPTTRLPPQAPG